MKRALILLILLLLLTAAGCIGRAIQPAPPTPTATPASALNLAPPAVANGQSQFQKHQCVSCHGPQAAGGVGPQLARTTLDFPHFLEKVRNAIPPKPAYSPQELPDQDVYDIYAWLQQIQAGAKPTLIAPPAVQVQPGQETLPDGPILGMSLWTGLRCDGCHGAFAQGAAQAPALAGLSYPYERERAKMRQTAAEIPEHSADFIHDVVLKRLYQWLQQGAQPLGGC